MTNRFAIYVFSLAYPALLGTFLFGLIPLGLPRSAEQAAMWLMVVYFVTQYAEGVVAAKPGTPGHVYPVADFAFNLAEMAVMVLVFVALGAFDGAGTPGDPVSHKAQLSFLPLDPLRDQWALMALAFALPPVERGLVRCGSWPSNRRGQHERFRGALSWLSAFAAAGALGGYGLDWAAVGFPAIALIVYFAVFIVNPPDGG